MILTHILLGMVILFFALRLFFAIREAKKAPHKIRLISKETGEILEVNMAEAPQILSDLVANDFTYTAKFIFTRVTDAFAKGRVCDIKKYLNDKVLPVFEQAVENRNKQQQTMEFSLIGFKEVKVLENHPQEKLVSFTTEQVNLLKDKENKVIEGDPLYVATVNERWTFTKEPNNNWVISRIEAGEAHFA
ncbi:MAG: TIM44-like domain-containing protein [Alphaproteobacteria bacterium]|nr:TIM44-like domain-containing protein [Alphaproteobacteria bacterium]